MKLIAKVNKPGLAPWLIYSDGTHYWELVLYSNYVAVSKGTEILQWYYGPDTPYIKGGDNVVARIPLDQHLNWNNFLDLDEDDVNALIVECVL